MGEKSEKQIAPKNRHDFPIVSSSSSASSSSSSSSDKKKEWKRDDHHKNVCSLSFSREQSEDDETMSSFLRIIFNFTGISFPFLKRAIRVPLSHHPFISSNIFFSYYTLVP